MPLTNPTGVRRLFNWALILAAWTLIVLTFSVQAYVFAVARGRPDNFWHEFLSASSDWYIWAALTPLVLLLCRRFRITPQNWRSTVPIHLAAGVVISFLQLAIQVRLNFIVNPGYKMTYWRVIYFFATFKGHINLLTYWVIVALNHGIYYYEQSRARELAWSRMETDLANAQLQVLNMQLHPHFLFNTLHSISTLISEDPQTARQMVLKLSDLLRASLNKIEQPAVPLQQELELLECYISIEQTRFKDRLTIEKEIAPDALACEVPTMILQPLVENAVRHGIGKHRQADRISIIAQRSNGRLLLEVRNRIGSVENGGSAPARGIGLTNTRARLEQLYGNHHSFDIADREGGGVAVKLSLPAHGDGTNAAASKADES
ncbi:MAG TPA: histidine kinase [Candidatus Elarobacter sp.]|nr:histidine kinase [Candidatus Elarobacter sp.]